MGNLTTQRRGTIDGSPRNNKRTGGPGEDIINGLCGGDFSSSCICLDILSDASAAVTVTVDLGNCSANRADATGRAKTSCARAPVWQGNADPKIMDRRSAYATPPQPLPRGAS